MSSILTNNGAMVALQTLKSINGNLATTQSEISTGKSVSSAKDNAAVWAIAKTMEADVKGFTGITDSLNLGQSTVAVARSAAEAFPLERARRLPRTRPARRRCRLVASLDGRKPFGAVRRNHVNHIHPRRRAL